MKARLLMAALAAFVLLAANGAAQNASFRPDDRATVGLSEQFPLVHRHRTVNERQEESAAAGLSKFRIMSGLNNRQHADYQWSSLLGGELQLCAQPNWKFTIRAAAIEAGGRAQSQPVTIEIVKAAPRKLAGRIPVPRRQR
jgi:hypothetical protein